MKIRQEGFVIIIAIVSLLLVAGVCLAVFLPGSGDKGESVNASDEQDIFVVEEVERGEPLSGPEEMMEAARSEVQRRIPLASNIIEYSTGAEAQCIYLLETVSGESAGLIGIDAYGDVISLLDFTKDAILTDVNLDKEQAEAAAEELLGELGFEKGYLTAVDSELRSTGATGPPSDPVNTWEYIIEFKPCLNGIFVDESDSCEVRLSPVDGSVLGLNVVRSPLRLVEAPAEILISEEEVLELALQKVKEDGEELALIVTEDGSTGDGGVRLRYVFSEQFIEDDPMLCWRVTLTTIPESPADFGGREYDVVVNALTGKVLIFSVAYY